MYIKYIMKSYGNKLKGGAGAADFAQSVYGDIGKHQSVSETDNSIRMNKMGGGAGAAEFGQSVYGEIGKQQAVSATDNTILMNKMGGGAVPLMPSNIIGGNYKKNGGNMLSNISVPAGLLLANTIFKRGQGMNKSLNNSVRNLRRSIRFKKNKSRSRSRRKSKRR